MSSREALIIVVPENSNDSALNLSIVRQDAELLERSLRESMYAVTVQGTGHPSDSAKGRIQNAIRKACEKVHEDGTLLIFYSGHGLHFDGHDYLVPWDADLQDTSIRDYLVPVGDISQYVDNSKAGLVVFFVDACREGVLLDRKSISHTQWGTERRRHAQRRHFVIVFSCKKGEFSHYVSGNLGFSLFSRAIAHVLTIKHPAKSLSEVISGAQVLLAKLSSEHDKNQQHISCLVESDLVGDPLKNIICEGRLAPNVNANPRSWEDGVRYSNLWTRLAMKSSDRPRVALWMELVANIAARAEDAHRAAAKTIGEDPWRDSNYPLRVIHRLEELTANSSVLNLSLSEVALLLVAPFAREHAYAGAIYAFSAIRPVDLESATDLSAGSAELRRRFETTLRAYPHLIRRVRQFYASSKDDARTRIRGGMRDGRSVMLWLLHRHLLRFPAMWHAEPDGTLPSANLVPSFPEGDPDVLREAHAALSLDRILKLAKCVRSEADRLTRGDMPQPLEIEVRIKVGGDAIRERLLGCLLCIAGWMALDLRIISEVVVDHIGIGDPVDSSQLAASLGRALWAPVGHSLQLKVECQHPAIDFVLRELVTEANRVLTSVNKILADDHGHTPVVNLPGQLSADGIAAALEEGRPAYSTPHQRFTLAHNEIRELLMGEQLYQDPTLAIRELYQNALDACRYRRARSQYLKMQGRPSQWQGKIVFHQGLKDGRSYIECQDNGIGMGLYEIENCFSCAGKRFADMPEFIEEQELWSQCQPKIEMVPNSQFGIGVLSYFMIADEIELITCRLDREGRIGNEILVKIPGSGSLFRMQVAGKGTESGTRVRLYLRENLRGNRKILCHDILKELLFIAEFETEVSNRQIDNSESSLFLMDFKEWQRNKWNFFKLFPFLKSHYKSLKSLTIRDDTPIRWQPDQPRDTIRYLSTDSSDFWWDKHVSGGQALADGIAVNIRGGVEYHLKGALINFRNRQKPRLSVDRRVILEYDLEWAFSAYKEAAKHLINASWLSLQWLWNLDKKILSEIIPTLQQADLYIPIYADEVNMQYQGFSTSAEKELWIFIFFQLAMPIRILGIGLADHNFRSDHDLVKFLYEANSVTEPDKQLKLLNSVTRLNLWPDHLELLGKEKTWFVDKLASLQSDRAFRSDHSVQRVELFMRLGVPAPEWLRALLPSPTTSLEANAKVLPNPQASITKRKSKLQKFSRVINLIFSTSLAIVVGIFLIKLVVLVARAMNRH